MMPSRSLSAVRLPIVLCLAVIAAAGCGGGGDPLADRRESPRALTEGRDLYVTSCSLCHGTNADGQGMRAASLVTPPTDFTDPEWQAKAEADPQQVYNAIRLGVEGTAMPAWPAFSEDETWNLVAYLLSVGEPAPTG